MSPRAKASYLAAVAALAILYGMSATPDMAVAQSGIQLAQADRDGRRSEARREQRREARSDRQERREARSERRERREARRDNNRQRIVIRSHRDRDHDRWRRAERSFASVSFIVLGPRVVYHAYGPGWCRGLHRGHHWDRRVGWHAGRHYGPFRC